jgi:hypothetical protein
MFVCVYSVFVLSCVGSGLETGWSLVQEVLPIVYTCKITEPHNVEARARYGLQRHIRRRRRRRNIQMQLITDTHLKIWESNKNSISLKSPKNSDGKTNGSQIHLFQLIWKDAVCQILTNRNSPNFTTVQN